MQFSTDLIKLQLTSRNIANRQLRIVSQKFHLRIAKIDQSIEQFLHLLAGCVLEQETSMARRTRQNEVKMPNRTFGIVDVEDVIVRRNTCKM